MDEQKVDKKSDCPIPKTKRKTNSKLRKSLSENFKNEILNYNVPELRPYHNKLRLQI